MSAPGKDILAFLDTAITARERKATEAADEYGADWYYDDGLVLARREDDMVATGSQDFLERKPGKHIALNDPASVLRRCAADRKLIAHYTDTATIRDNAATEIRKAQQHGVHPSPSILDDWGRANSELSTMLPLVEFLAEGYGWTEGER